MDIMAIFGDMISWCDDVFSMEYTIPNVATFNLWDVALIVIVFVAGGRVLRNGLALDEHD